MKKVYLCLLFCLLFTSCTKMPEYTITYDDTSIYIQTPPAHSIENNWVKVYVNPSYNVKLYANDIIIAPHDVTDDYIMFEFYVSNQNIHITHTKENSIMQTSVTIPAQFYRLQYTDFNSTFSGQYKIITNQDDFSHFIQNYQFSPYITTDTTPTFNFDTHFVVACHINEGSGSVNHRLKDATLIDKNLTINLIRESPSFGTCDMASYLCLISISKQMTPAECNIHISITDKMV